MARTQVVGATPRNPAFPNSLAVLDFSKTAD
jgi:hypothetical protein